MESSRISKLTGTSNAALVRLANYYQCQRVKGHKGHPHQVTWQRLRDVCVS